jgi:hypothetical protein
MERSAAAGRPSQVVRGRDQARTMILSLDCWILRQTSKDSIDASILVNPPAGKSRRSLSFLRNTKTNRLDP